MSSNAKSHPFVLLSVNFQASGESEGMHEFEFYEYFMFLSVHISEKIFGHLKAKVQYMMC